MVMVKVAIVILHHPGLHGFDSGNLEPFNPEGYNGVVDDRLGDLLRLHRLRRDLHLGRRGREAGTRPAIAIIASLAICTLRYILVSTAAVGAMPFKDLDGQEAPLADVLRDGAGFDWGRP